MKFILGTKEYMTQLFDEAGNVHPVTVVRTGPSVVTQVKTSSTDGYSAVQVGYGARREALVSKAIKGHVAAAKEKNADMKMPSVLREALVSKEDAEKVSVGDTLSLESFAEGDEVRVVGTSKSRGFQGVVKRHGFHGGPRSHGQKHSERAPGSLGAGGVQRVFKGMRMAGRMGGARVTIKNLKVIKIDKDAGEIFIKGAIPGRRGSLVAISA